MQPFNFVSFCFHFTFVLEIELLSIYLYRSIILPTIANL